MNVLETVIRSRVARCFALASLVLAAPAAWPQAFSVPNTFAAGTPAVAADMNTNFSAAATAINSKQKLVTGNCPPGQAVQSVLATGGVTCEAVPIGGLMNVLSDNNGAVPLNATGYVNIVSNFVPAFNGTAMVMTRCSGTSTTVGDVFAHRVAIRSPATTGTVTIGTQFYHFPAVPAANITIMNTNNDTFPINAGVSYDFGVNIIDSFNVDICSAVVMVFRR